jgi:tetratricopeptide (TPR) repeat protein
MSWLKIIIGIVICLLLAFQAGMNGFANWYEAKAIADSDIDAAKKATRLAPFNADVHATFANILLQNGQSADAMIEFEKAVALRPADFRLWLQLSSAREKNSATEEAIKALHKAIRHAPFYAEPRWQLGRLLLQTGRIDEAFAEIRQAVVNDANLLPTATELAWQTFNGNTTKVVQALQPANDTARITIAHFFVKHGKIAEAMSLFRSASGLTAQERREFLIDLLEAKRFAEGYEVWAGLRNSQGNGVAKINDPDFEGQVVFNDIGFGWQLVRGVKGANFALDASQSFSGKQSLRIDMRDVPGETPALLSQLVLVKPNTKYRLTYSACTKDLFALAGSPVLTITGAEGVSYDLAGSEPLSQGTNKWKTYSVNFVTEKNTTAVVIALRRQPCRETDCSIRGTIWLDNFELKSF